MARRDQRFDNVGNEVAFRLWPDDGSGGIDVDGQITDWDSTTRPLTQDEKDAITAEVDQAGRDADLASLGVDFQDLKDKRDNAQTRQSDIAAWVDIADLDVSGTTNTQRVAALQTTVQELIDRSNEMHPQVRFAWGRIRQLYITAIRMIRTQRLDA